MTNKSKSVSDILKTIKDEEIDFVDFTFTDSTGKFHHTSYRSTSVGKHELEEGVNFDGSSIEGWKDIHESDMTLKPDLSSAFINPFTSHSTLVFICDVIDTATSEIYEKDPRNIARKAEKYLKSTAIADKAYFGPELEFFIFDDIRFSNDPHNTSFYIDCEEGGYNSNREYNGGNRGHRPGVQGGYFPLSPVDSSNDIRAEIALVAESIGIKTNLHHHEVAEGQCEIGFEYDRIVESGDNVQKFKYVTKNVCASFGKSATFMPKPLFGDNGSGMHTHQSIWKEAANLFYEKGNYADLSETCLYYIGGIIKHAKAINAFSNSSTNSYKRLVPGFEAPVKLAYSAKNRSASIRIPHVYSANAKRIEARFPDPSCNSYLTFAAMLMAGIDGIKNKIHPGAAVDENLYDLDEHSLNQIPSVASSLKEALSHLDQNRKFLTIGGVFTDKMIDSYIGIKMREAVELETRPHPIEFKMYYSC
jgi:glutamine synthetase